MNLYFSSASSSQDLWESANDETRFLIVVFDENPESLYGKLLLMDVSSRIKDLNVPIELRFEGDFCTTLV
jgi:hypothetical protein